MISFFKKTSDENNAGLPVAGSMAAGMAVAQVIATLQVYLSNAGAYEQMQAVLKAGYLPVPNSQTLPQLLHFGSAFWGGLFFTLTVGAFISLVTIGFLWMYITVYRKAKWALAAGAAALAILLCCLNCRHIDVLTTLYFLSIPPAVSTVFLKKMKGRSERTSRRSLFLAICHTAVITVLALVWTTQLDRRMFVDFRDSMLLSNPVGSRINSYYYKYTLYPAAVFTPLEQKLIKTVHIKGVSDRQLLEKIEAKCIAQDYLPMEKGDMADLLLYIQRDQIVYGHNGDEVLKTSAKAFLNDARQALGEYSKQADGHAFFRRFTFISLLIGLPVFLYIFFFAGVRAIALLFCKHFPGNLVSVVICFAVGLALLIPFHNSRAGQYGEKDVASLLASKDWMDRVNGLKVIYEKRLEPDNFPEYRTGLTSPHMPERYWVSLVLGQSRKPGTLDDLTTMMDDASPNVACQALYAVGRRKRRAMIPVVLDRMATSRHWYVQTYAYRALRELGWKQKKSNPATY